MIRFKLALTEDEPPTIRPYYEDRWAELADSKLPVDVSLNMIDGIHKRWLALLESMYAPVPLPRSQSVAAWPMPADVTSAAAREKT